LVRPRARPGVEAHPRALTLVEELLAGDADRLGAVVDIVDVALRTVAAAQRADALRRPA
jgi:hypothetical protein